MYVRVCVRKPRIRIKLNLNQNPNYELANEVVNQNSRILTRLLPYQYLVIFFK